MLRPRVRRWGAPVGLILVMLLVASCSGVRPDTASTRPSAPSSLHDGGQDDASRHGVPDRSVQHEPADGRGTAAAPGAPSACPLPGPRRVYSVDQLNQVMHGLTLPQWRAADAGASVRLRDGRRAWIFGDTLRPENSQPLVNANSVLIGSDLCFTHLQVPGGGAVLDLDRKGYACWPSSVVAVPVKGRDRLYVGCERVQRLPGGLLNFTYLGASMGQLSVTPGRMPQLEGLIELTPDQQERQVAWGAAMMRHDGYVYVYGSKRTVTTTGKSVYVARVRELDVMDRAAWRYWDGRQWSSDANAARRTMSAQPGVAQSFSVYEDDGRFVLVSKKGGEFGDAIGVWTASSPVGPWRLESQTPYPYDDGSGFVTYHPLAHPDLELNSGKLLVSMSRNPKSFSDLLADPRRGRPVFVEVPRP